MEVVKISEQGNEFLKIKNNSNLELVLSTLGASTYYIKYKNRTVTYHPESIDEFISSKKYYGKTLGRVAGRLLDGVIEVNNKKYQLEQNENGNTLHGGINNLSFVKWSYEINENDNDVNVVFKYTSPDLECGFPSEVRCIVIYSISKNTDKFTIHYHAFPSGITPINMTSHIYWRLDGENVLKHTLLIDADEKTVVNKDNLVTISKEKLTPEFDFRKEKEIGKDIVSIAKKEPVANGYDHGFIFNKSKGPNLVMKGGAIKLIVNTNMPQVNVYTNNWATGGKIKDFGDDITYGGVAIEPQMFYTSFKDLLISPEKPFDRYITFILEDVK